VDDGARGSVKTNVTVRVFRPTSTTGTTDPDTGVFTPGGGDATPFYEGRGMLLDEGQTTDFTLMGTPEMTADAQMFLPRGTVLREGIQDADTLTAEYGDGTTIDAVVVKAVRFKDCLYLKRA
jgi:hypothetical protein